MDFPVVAVVAQPEVALVALAMVALVLAGNMVVANLEAASDGLVMVDKRAVGAEMSERLDVPSYRGHSVYSTSLGRKRFLRKMDSA